MSVVAVDRMIFFVFAASQLLMATGLDGKNGGLWCSPIAKTSRPTSSACWAIVSTSCRREASVGVFPVVGSVVMSPTLKIPNCMGCVMVIPKVYTFAWISYTTSGFVRVFPRASGAFVGCRAGGLQRQDGVQFKRFEARPSAQPVQLEHHANPGYRATRALQQACRRADAPSGGEHIVEDQHPVPGRHVVRFDLQRGRPVFERVLLGYHRAGELARLAYGNHAGTGAIGDSGCEQEPARLDSRHSVKPSGEGIAEVLNDRGEAGSIRQHRSEVAEQDALLGEVGDGGKPGGHGSGGRFWHPTTVSKPDGVAVHRLNLEDR